MNAADIIDFLYGNLAAPELEKRIRAEVDAWKKKLSERGRSAPVLLLGMHQSIDVTPARAARLLDGYLANDFSPASFAYILDALLMDERFRWTSVSVREALEHVLGDEYPRRLDRRRAWQAKAELKALAAN